MLHVPCIEEDCSGGCSGWWGLVSGPVASAFASLPSGPGVGPPLRAQALSCMFRVCSRGLALSVSNGARTSSAGGVYVCVCVPAPQHLRPQGVPRTAPVPCGQRRSRCRANASPPFLLRRGHPPARPVTRPSPASLLGPRSPLVGNAGSLAGYAPGRPVQPAFSLPPRPQAAPSGSPAPVLPSPGALAILRPLHTPHPEASGEPLFALHEAWVAVRLSQSRHTPCGLRCAGAAPDMGRTRPWAGPLVWSLSHRAHPAGSHPPCCSDAGRVSRGPNGVDFASQFLLSFLKSTGLGPWQAESWPNQL